MKTNSVLLPLILWATISSTLAQSPKLVLPIGHTNHITSAHFSPNGKYVVTGSNDWTAKIWEAASGKLLNTLEGHTVQFSPDGKYIVTIPHVGTGKIWEVATDQLLHTLTGDSIRFAQYSPDGNYIATAGSSVIIWDAATGKLIRSMEGHPDNETIHSALFSPDGKYIISAGSRDNRGDSKIWEVATGKLFSSLDGHPGSVSYAQYSSDGKYIYTLSTDSVSYDGTVWLWNAQSGQTVRILKGENAMFSPDAKYLAVYTSDNKIIVEETQSGKKFKSMRMQNEGINTMEFSPDGQYIITSSSDGAANLWNVKSGKRLKNFYEEDLPRPIELTTAKFSPDGKYVLTACYDSANSRGSIWEISSGKLIHSLMGYSKAVTSARPTKRWIIQILIPAIYV